MSLKDRLNSNKIQNQKPKAKEIKEAVLEPKYYETNEEALKVNSLGIIDTILADDEINSIFVNGAKNIYVEKKGKITKIGSTFRDEVQLENIVKKYLEYNGLDFEEKYQFSLNHKKGINVSITLPPLSKKITLSLKCYNEKFASLKTMQESQCISKEAALFLETFSSLNINVLIIGEKKSLKTTTLNAIINNTQNNNSSVIIDYLNEIETLNNSCAYFDFSILNSLEEEKNIIDSLVYSSPDKIFINSPNEKMLNEIFKIASKNKGIVTTIEAMDFDELKEKIPNIEKAFDIVILTKKIPLEAGKIASIAQINQDSIENIFSLNESNQLTSCGVIPKIYDEIKLNSLSVNQNIFEKDYKHTYYKNFGSAIEPVNKKNVNLDVLKKFKKDKALDALYEQASRENIESSDNNGNNENI